MAGDWLYMVHADTADTETDFNSLILQHTSLK